MDSYPLDHWGSPGHTFLKIQNFLALLSDVLLCKNLGLNLLSLITCPEFVG